MSIIKKTTHKFLICLFAIENFIFSQENQLNISHEQLSYCLKI